MTSYLLYSLILCFSLNNTTFIKEELTISTGSDSLQIGIYLDSTEVLLSNNHSKANLYLDSAIHLLEISDLLILKARSDVIKARIHKSDENFNQAEAYFIQGLKTYIEKSFYSEASQVLVRLGDMYMENGLYKQSMNSYIEACKHAEQTDDDMSLGYAYRGISYLYHQYHEPKKALENIQRAYQIAI